MIRTYFIFTSVPYHLQFTLSYHRVQANYTTPLKAPTLNARLAGRQKGQKYSRSQRANDKVDWCRINHRTHRASFRNARRVSAPILPFALFRPRALLYVSPFKPTCNLPPLSRTACFHCDPPGQIGVPTVMGGGRVLGKDWSGAFFYPPEPSMERGSQNRA